MKENVKHRPNMEVDFSDLEQILNKLVERAKEPKVSQKPRCLCGAEMEVDKRKLFICPECKAEFKTSSLTIE